MSVRLLLNENFPAPSVTILRAAAFDILSTREAHTGMADPEVLALAVRDQRWLVTFDRDYGELLFARGYDVSPAALLLRVRSYQPHEPAEWVQLLAGDEASYLVRFTVFNGETLRSRPFLR